MDLSSALSRSRRMSTEAQGGEPGVAGSLLPSYVADNNRSRARLRRVIEEATERDLTADLGGGWSVATALAHLAFWDHRAAVLFRRWRANGVSPSPVDVDSVNEALQPLLVTIPPRQAARTALAAAEAADQEVATFPESWVGPVAALTSSIRLRRATHREEHLDQIERALGRGGRSA